MLRLAVSRQLPVQVPLQSRICWAYERDYVVGLLGKPNAKDAELLSSHLLQSYRAVDESEVMSLQWDLAEYVLQGRSQVVKPPASIAQGCPHVGAIPTVPVWRSAKDEKYLASVPECSRYTATKGRYLRAHYTEPHTFNGFIFQPDGCKWSNRACVVLDCTQYSCALCSHPDRRAT